MHDRAQRKNRDPQSFAERVEGAIFAMDQALLDLEKEIELAPSREKLEGLQAARLDLLQRRSDAESVLTAVRLGLLDEHGSPAGERADDGPS